ncbi:MAG: Hpt domain-containing protein, partial [Treponema sp.]|nr:Hpt domain-containing protein [Treponema sp.]
FKRPEIEAALRKWLGVRRESASPAAISVPEGAGKEPAAAAPPTAFPSAGSAPVAAAGERKPAAVSVPASAPASTPVAAAADPAIFDHADLMETFMNEEETARSLLAQFIARTADQIAAIPGLAERQDWESARREAHTIKGSALTMGGRELGKAAARLELAFRNVDRAEMKAAWKPVKEAFSRFKTAAEAYLAGAV